MRSSTSLSVRRPYQVKLSVSNTTSDMPNHQRHFRSRFVSPSTRLKVRYDMALIRLDCRATARMGPSAMPSAEASTRTRKMPQNRTIRRLRFS